MRVIAALFDFAMMWPPVCHQAGIALFSSKTAVLTPVMRTQIIIA
jgi:hypothetical protein